MTILDDQGSAAVDRLAVVDRTITVIRPPRRLGSTGLREVWQSRALMIRLTRRDLTLRYRQTALGVLWVVLQPILAAGALSFVFGTVAKLPSQNVPYFTFAFAGMLGWNVFASTLTKISGSLVGNQALISKVYFPRLVLPISTVGSSIVDFTVALALLIGIAVATISTPGPAILLVPLWTVLLLTMATGVGLVAAALMVRYRDIAYILPVATQLLLYGSPIAYSSAAVPERVRWVVAANPLTAALDGMRWSLLGTAPPTVGAVLYTALGGTVFLAVGLKTFASLQQGFADVI